MLRRLFGSRARRAYATGIEFYNAGELTAAIEYFDAALASENDASSPDASLARFYRGEAHARLGADQFERGAAKQALFHLDLALEDHPSYPDLHLQRGIALLCLDDPLAAEQAARRALERHAEFVEAGALLALSFAAQGQSQRAQQERDRWRELAAQRGHPALVVLATDPLELSALLHHRAGQRERRRSIERIDGLLHQGFWTDAQAHLQSLLEQNPHYPDLRLRMAAAMSGLGDDETAMSHLEAAIEHNPQFADAHVLAGIVALRRDHGRAALGHFEQAEQLGNRSSPLSYGRALCDLRSGDESGARRRLDSIWAAEEFHIEARFLRAALTYLDGDVEQALAQFADGLQATDQAELLLDAAACGLHAGRLGLVRRVVDALPPGAPFAAVAIVRARLLQAEGARDRALDVLEAATAQHPDDPAILFALAQGHYACGEHEVALRRLTDLAAVGEMVPGARALAARLHRAGGDLDAALAAVQTPAARDTHDSELAIEELFVLRALGEAERAGELWQRAARVHPLDLRWRLQGPRRWLRPLAPWPGLQHDHG